MTYVVIGYVIIVENEGTLRGNVEKVKGDIRTRGIQSEGKRRLSKRILSPSRCCYSVTHFFLFFHHTFNATIIFVLSILHYKP